MRGRKIIIQMLLLAMVMLNAKLGRITYNGREETYYNLPMHNIIEKAEKRGIYGDYWVREDGVKMYGHYVILAAPLDVHPYGSLVETSLGMGIVLDTGEFALTNKHQLDLATGW